MNNKAMLDEMRQKLIAWLAKYDHLMKEGYPPNVTETLDQILSLETSSCRIAVVKKEGELPHENLQGRYAYEEAQRTMLKDNWVKEVKLSE